MSDQVVPANGKKQEHISTLAVRVSDGHDADRMLPQFSFLVFSISFYLNTSSSEMLP